MENEQFYPSICPPFRINFLFDVTREEKICCEKKTSQKKCEKWSFQMMYCVGYYLLFYCQTSPSHCPSFKWPMLQKSSLTKSESEDGNQHANNGLEICLRFFVLN